MSPNLLDGDIILCIDEQRIDVGDIVVAIPEKLNHSLIIKRVESVLLSTLSSRSFTSQDGQGIRNSEVLHKPSYFLLGDNLENSLDSRNFGPIDANEIICVAKLVLANASLENISFRRFSVLWSID